jgi:hypothetical protein
MEDIGSTVIGFLTNKYFLINCVICIIMLEKGLSGVKLLHKRKAANIEDNDEKYESFRRNDLHRFHRPILYLFSPFILMRYGTAVVSWAILATTTRIVMIGHKEGDPISGFRGWFLHFCIKYTAKITMICIGCFFIDIKNVEVDYEEYLGPDWKKNGIDFDKCGSVVVNH